uniref:DUF4585 domain-containing protein n=1 Tax=Poecilia mexicana TaxID=48701 RepID=A0A3B3WNM6_9TELE
MTSVEKRRSSRKSSGHRKHSDGGFSDTSSGGSFLDETDREVSNLTDRAFRSLCIGDEAVYNDSDLSLSSPSTYSDRQLGFCRYREEREREDRKRAAQENFNFSVQQYGQDWITAGMYGAEIQREAQWEAYGDRTQGMVSATFQHSLVETSQLGKSLREEELSFHSNGATELSSQQRRSHSRVSSLIRAFNSDGHRDGAGAEDNIRERDDGTSWDKSALMSIQRELSEFSYQQNFNHHFHPAGPFSCRDPNFYSSEAEAVAQMSHSYMRSSQTKHIMSAQANCNSNFFIHSEFSPFQLWRDYNRFPFRQAEVSGFMHYSEFPKWYQTPMYNELSLENQAHGRHRDIRQSRNHLEYQVPLTAPRSISTSSQIQRASAVEKRCESELAVHHPHRKWTQSLGTNKLPPHRPSTASPSTEMSRRVRDTIGSVKALQQKAKMMSEYDTSNQQETFSRNESWFNSGNNTLTAETNIVGSNKANSFRIGNQLTPSVQQHQDVDTSRLHQHEVSPQPVEHPPVRAESRGATPDVRMSSYRSRATSLLFNLKDNRKRVKSTYSPTKFKGLDTPERNQQPHGQEPHETAFTSSDVQCLQPEAPRSTNAAINQYHSPGLSLTAQTSHPTRVNTGHYSENTEQRQVKQVKEQIVSNTEKETKGKAREGINVFISEKESVKQTQELNRIQQRNEVPMNESLVEEKKTASRKMLKNENIAAEKEEIMGEQRTKKHFKQEKAKESKPTKTDNDSQANKMEDEEQVSSLKVKARDRQEMDKETAQKTDALQYFAITSTNRETRSREKQLSSASPLQQQNKKQGELESPNDLLYQRHYRPHAAASPAPTLPRSNTSSPAPGAKPLMFRVKDNTIRGSSLTKSVKPRFHKNFGEDFLMGSTFDGAPDKAEDDQEIIRRNAGTPLSRFVAFSESAALFSPSSLQDYSSTTPQLRPYSRRSMATDDDESRSVISSMSEDVESFATSASDLTEMHGPFDFDRPESACSFSSDVSRSLGKPPAVPPKSEKALRRAQRLTSRRMKKELSKAAEGNPVCSSNHHAVASPHFSPPVAFTLAPATGSSLPSFHKDRKSSHRSFHASPHATGPISIPSPLPHSTNYPLTQRKVLQDLGSGQFFVVDVPVQVKTKTFFDPETGKYVQLNVRQTGQNISQPQLQQKYQQPQVQQQLQVKQQPQSLSSVTTVASKPLRFYQGYHSSPQNYQAAVVNSMHESSSSAPAALHQSQQASRENHSCRSPVPEIDQNSEGHRYSPEKTPYMDTVNDITKTYNLVNSTRDSCNPFPECDTNSPLGRSSVCENEYSANLEYQPRDIIAISELEDFMEVSDW